MSNAVALSGGGQIAELKAAVCSMLQEAGKLKNEADGYRKSGQLYDCYVSLSSSYYLLKNAGEIVKRLPLMSSECSAAQCTETECRIGDAAEKLQREREALHEQVKRYLDLIPSGKTSDVSEGETSVCKQIVRFQPGSDECANSWFDLIVGVDDAKTKLKTQYINPLLYPNMTPGARATLLYGPPGTGKTLLAKACVNEIQQKSMNNFNILFIAPAAAELKGKYVGETEKLLTNLWMGASALATAVTKETGKRTIAIIFIDEVDALAPSGRGGEGAQAAITASAVNTLLQLMDGFNSPKNVSLICATNFPWALDDAFLRRFSSQILIDLPEQADILRMLKEMLSRHFSARPKPESELEAARTPDCRDTRSTCSMPAPPRPDKFRDEPFKYYLGPYYGDDDSKLEEIADACHQQGFSPSDVARLFNEAVRVAANEAINNIRFFKALNGDGSAYQAETVLGTLRDADKKPVQKVLAQKTIDENGVESIKQVLGPDGKPVMSNEFETTTESRDVYVSTLCLPLTSDKLEFTGAGGKVFPIQLELIRYPEVASITVNGTTYNNYALTPYNIGLTKAAEISDIFVAEVAGGAIEFLIQLNFNFIAKVPAAVAGAAEPSRKTTVQGIPLDQPELDIIKARSKLSQTARASFDAALRTNQIGKKVSATVLLVYSLPPATAGQKGWLGGLWGGKADTRTLDKKLQDAIATPGQVKEWYVGSVSDWRKGAVFDYGKLKQLIHAGQPNGNSGFYPESPATDKPAHSAAAIPAVGTFPAAAAPSQADISLSANVEFTFSTGQPKTDDPSITAIVRNSFFRTWNLNPSHFWDPTKEPKALRSVSSFVEKDVNDLRLYSRGEKEAVLRSRRPGGAPTPAA